MLFNSYAFLIFLPIIIILHWVLPHKLRWVVLLMASYYFYMSWNPLLVFLILGTTAISYGGALLIERSKSQKARKAYLITVIVVALSVLFFFKYFDFLSTSVTELIRSFGLPCGTFTLNLLLPVGISFYTFQTLSYAIDVYRGTVKAERHFGYYALFVAFFPQLVAGPIERPGNLLPQLKAERKFKSDDFKTGMKFVIVGFVKKVVIADTLAPFVNNVFNSPSEATGVTVLVATLLFAVQILCDFDGYTNIAIGCAKMMGVQLAKNFDNPYGATTIKGFWRGWHITLTSWLTEYVYIPLGGSRCKKSRHMINILIVFLLSGLWHGANWTFVLWGLTHGIYQVVGNLTAPARGKLKKKMGIDEQSAGWKFVQRVITFSLVCFAWIIFRANSIYDLGVLLGKLFGEWSFSPSYFTKAFEAMGMTLFAAMFCICAIVLLYLISKNLIDKPDISIGTNGSATMVKNALYAILTVILVIVWIFVVSQTGYSNAFIYFQF